MADTDIKPTTASPTTQPSPPTEPAIDLAGRTRPIVVRIKGKKRRRYSRSLKGLQRSLSRFNKVGDRIGEAIAAGFSKYRKKSDKSARKKKDGLLRDSLENAAASLGTTLRKSSKIPVLVARSFRGRSRRRSVRNLSRMLRVFRR